MGIRPSEVSQAAGFGGVAHGVGHGQRIFGVRDASVKKHEASFVGSAARRLITSVVAIYMPVCGPKFPKEWVKEETPPVPKGVTRFANCKWELSAAEKAKPAGKYSKS